MSRRNKCGCRYSTSSDASVRKGFSLSGSLMEECAQHEAQRHNSSRLQAQQPAETACKDCNGDGKQCFAGHSAHPSNWHKCETCGGTGNAQQPAAAEYTPGDYGIEVGATTHTPAAAAAVPEVAESDIDYAARTMAVIDGWDGWDTATGCNDTLSGNEPEEEREHYRDLASTIIAAYRARLIERMKEGGE